MAHKKGAVVMTNDTTRRGHYEWEYEMASRIDAGWESKDGNIPKFDLVLDHELPVEPPTEEMTLGFLLGITEPRE